MAGRLAALAAVPLLLLVPTTASGTSVATRPASAATASAASITGPSVAASLVTSTPATAPAEVRRPPAPVPYSPPDTDHMDADAVSVAPLTGTPARPNVVVIMTDDARDDDLRYMPNVRRLIGDAGVRFTNTFSPQPLCCPARASFLTGQYTHNHHVWSHADPYGFQALDDTATLPVWLQDAGYRTVFLGKYLNGYGIQLKDGRPSQRYVPPGWTDWRASIDGGEPVGTPLAGSTYNFTDTTLDVNGRLEPHPGAYQTRLFSRISQDLFRDAARSPEPLFAWLSFVAPHHGGPHEADDPQQVRRVDGHEQTFQTTARPREVRGRFDAEIQQAPGHAGEKDVSDKPFFIRDRPPMNAAEQQALTEVTRQRAEALSVVDDEVARMLAVLDETGELDDTYVLFTSDNGYFLGEHRIRQGKILPYEPSLRVPLLVRGPGIAPGGSRADPFTMIDFAPTILDMASVAVPPSVDGESLLDVARGGDRGWQRGILTETGPREVSGGLGEDPSFLVRAQGPSLLRFSQGVRTARFLYVEHASHERELYDLRTDPGELTNLVDRPAYAGVVRALAAELDRLRDCRGAGCRTPLPGLLRR
jgi:arylsulfatase A-like enzyme